jgi:hypothetical protein
MPVKFQKFATLVDPDKIATIRAIAKDEDCQIRTLVNEALGDLIEKRKLVKPRTHAMYTWAGAIAESNAGAVAEGRETP